MSVEKPLLTRRSKIILAALMIVAVLAGYLGYLYRSARSVSVEGISIEEIRVSGVKVHMRVGLKLFNPAIQGLEADRIKYKVYLENIYIGSGETGPVNLKPRGLTNVSLPLNSSVITLGLKVLPVLASAISRGEIRVKVTGTIKLKIRVMGLELRGPELPYLISETVKLTG